MRYSMDDLHQLFSEEQIQEFRDFNDDLVTFNDEEGYVEFDDSLFTEDQLMLETLSRTMNVVINRVNELSKKIEQLTKMVKLQQTQITELAKAGKQSAEFGVAFSLMLHQITCDKNELNIVDDLNEYFASIPFEDFVRYYVSFESLMKLLIEEGTIKIPKPSKSVLDAIMEFYVQLKLVSDSEEELKQFMDNNWDRITAIKSIAQNTDLLDYKSAGFLVNIFSILEEKAPNTFVEIKDAISMDRLLEIAKHKG